MVEAKFEPVFSGSEVYVLTFDSSYYKYILLYSLKKYFLSPSPISNSNISSNKHTTNSMENLTTSEGSLLSPSRNVNYHSTSFPILCTHKVPGSSSCMCPTPASSQDSEDHISHHTHFYIHFSPSLLSDVSTLGTSISLD